MKRKRTDEPELSIVIPVYNEPENIKATLDAIHKNTPVSHEILVIYDVNNDTTIPVLKKLQKRYNNLYLLKNSVKKGPSGALRTGFQNSRAQLILVTMADLCDDLTQIKSLLRIVPKKAAIAAPSRYIKKGRQELHSSPVKVFIPKMVGRSLHLLTGIGTNDPTNSYKLYAADTIHTMELTSVTSFSVTLEIVAKAHVLGYRIAEIPTVWLDRKYGKTNFNLTRSLIPYLKWYMLALSRNRLFRIPFKYLGLE